METCFSKTGERSGPFLTAVPSRHELNLSHSTSIKSLIKKNLKQIQDQKNNFPGEKLKVLKMSESRRRVLQKLKLENYLNTQNLEKDAEPQSRNKVHRNDSSYSIYD